MSNIIKIKLQKNSALPIKAHYSDAGFDLFATYDFSITRGQVVKHPLNFIMELPKDTYGEITSKSGLGAKGIQVYAGIIDQNYRGIPHVIMVYNSVGEQYRFVKGDKIAQLIIHPFSLKYEIQQVDDINTETDRGIGGFGSTGK